MNNNLGEIKIPGATISGTVYNDVNGDGIHQSTEKGLAGNPVGLYDLNNKNLLVATATTNSLGQYTFLNVKPGAYRVTALGTLRTSAPSGGYINLTNVVSKGVYSGEVFEKTSNVLLEGSLYLDLNNDGKFEPATEAIKGAKVTIKSGANIVATAITDGAGNFSVTSLGAGTYTISAVATTGATFASPVGGIYTTTIKASAVQSFLFREVKSTAKLPSLVGTFKGTVSTSFGGSGLTFVIASTNTTGTSVTGSVTIDVIGLTSSGTYTGSIDPITGKFTYSRVDSKGAHNNHQWHGKRRWKDPYGPLRLQRRVLPRIRRLCSDTPISASNSFCYLTHATERSFITEASAPLRTRHTLVLRLQGKSRKTNARTPT